MRAECGSAPPSIRRCRTSGVAVASDGIGGSCDSPPEPTISTRSGQEAAQCPTAAPRARTRAIVGRGASAQFTNTGIMRVSGILADSSSIGCAPP
jgi:hypothetical protein